MCTLAQVVSGLLGPALTDRVTDMRGLLLGSAGLAVVGFFGVFVAPLTVPWLWAPLIGMGQGSAFSLGLVLLVRYARTPEASARLSGMSFLVCYLLASVGPLTMGALSDATGTLTPTWLVLTIVAIGQGSVAVLLRPNREPVA